MTKNSNSAKKDHLHWLLGLCDIQVMYLGTIYIQKKFWTKMSTGSRDMCKFRFLHLRDLSQKLLVKPTPEKI